MFSQSASAEPLIFLLDLTWAGQVYHIAEQAMDITIDGEVVRYDDGLVWGGNIDDEFGDLGADPSQRTVELTLHIQQIVDIPAAIMAGYSLGSAMGQLYQYSPATGELVEMIRGRLIDPTWDYDAPVTATLEEHAIRDDRGLHPDPTAKITEETFPSAPDASIGEWYPTVINDPSIFDEKKAATPAYYVGGLTTRYIVIAGAIASAATVRAVNTTTRKAVTSTVLSIEDSLGRTVAAIDADDFGTLGTDYDEDDVFRIDWSNGSGLDLGGLGEVLLWALNQTTVRWDRGRITAIRDQLNRYRPSTYIAPGPDEPGVKMMDWIRESLLPIIPASQAIGPNGWYLKLWRYDATLLDSTLHIETGRNADRIAGVSTSPYYGIGNEVRINFSVDSATDKATLSYTITGDQDYVATSDASNVVVSSLHARRSLDQYGEVERQALTLDAVTEEATAALVAGWMIRRTCCQRMGLVFEVDAVEAIGAQVGDIVDVTDSGIGIENRVGLVVGRGINSAGWVVMEVQIPAWDLGTAG